MAGIKIRGRYCISVPGILKWLQIAIAIIVISLILWDAYEKVKDENRTAGDIIDEINKAANDLVGKDGYYAKSYNIIKGEQYTCVLSILCIIVNLIFLIIFFLNCHMGPCVSCRCFTIASVYYGLSLVMWLAAAGVEIYATVQFKERADNKWLKINEGYYLERFRRRAAASALCILNAFLYLVSLQQAKYQDL